MSESVQSSQTRPSTRSKSRLLAVTSTRSRASADSQQSNRRFSSNAAATIIRRLYDRRAINGLATDEFAAALVDLGLPPNYALRHPRYPNGRWKESEAEFDCLFASDPFDVRSLSLGAFLDVAPSAPGPSPPPGTGSPMPTVSSPTPAAFLASRSVGLPSAVSTPRSPAAASSKPSASQPRPDRRKHQGCGSLFPTDLRREPAHPRKAPRNRRGRRRPLPESTCNMSRAGRSRRGVATRPSGDRPGLEGGTGVPVLSGPAFLRRRPCRQNCLTKESSARLRS